MRRLFLIGLFILLAFQVWGQDGQTVTINPGSSITLNANSEGAISYMWFKNGSLIPDQDQATLKVSEPGIYTVIGLGIACDSDMSDPVEVIIIDSPIPAKSVDMHIRNLPDRPAVLIGQPITYQIIVTNKGDEKASDVTAIIKLPAEVSYDQVVGMYRGEVSYNRAEHQLVWTLGEMNAGHSEVLTFAVHTERAGQAGQLAVVTSLQSESNPSDNSSNALVDIIALKIPNVFTPNGDGINDFFEIVGLEFLQRCNLIIFNPDGVEVYRHTNYNNTWNGDGLAPGVYFYLLEIRFEDGREQILKSHVTILK